MAQAQHLLFRKVQHETSTAVRLSATHQSAVQKQQAQSLQVVQDHLTTWIGSLSYLRGFFPSECFIKKAYGNTTSLPGPSGNRHEVMELAKGVTKEADGVLEILENGIFKALEDGHLRALQLGVYLDEETPDVVVESYTFSFSYRTDGELNVQITNQTGSLVAANAIKSAQQLTRTLVMITQGLHPLPDNRWLTMRLYYMENTPAEYNLPGFRRLAVGSPTLKIPETRDDETSRQNCGTMYAGYHAVSLKISSCSAGTLASFRPGRRFASRFCVIENDIETPSLTRARTITTAEQPCQGQVDQMAVGSTPNENSWKEHELAEKEALNDMLVSQSHDMNLVPTQVIQETQQLSSSPNKRSTGDSSLTQRSPKRQKPHQDLQMGIRDMVLTDNRMAAMQPQKFKGKGTKKGKRQKERVTCECGYRQEDGGMLCCDNCNGWQHAPCYGFWTVDDPQVPHKHFCYSCIFLKPDEDDKLIEMGNLALFRRALKSVWDSGKFPSSLDAFAAEIGCDTAKALELTKLLEAGGFAKLKGRGRSERLLGKVDRRYLLYDVIKSVATEQLKDDYFNPLKYIGHAYVPQNDPSTIVLDEMTMSEVRQPEGAAAAQVMQLLGIFRASSDKNQTIPPAERPPRVKPSVTDATATAIHERQNPCPLPISELETNLFVGYVGE